MSTKCHGFPWLARGSQKRAVRGAMQRVLQQVMSLRRRSLQPASPGLFDTSGLQPCAYILHLVATFHLTDGEYRASPIQDHLAFCVAPRS